MRDWWIERDLERLRDEQRPAVQVPLELPLQPAYDEPEAELSPDPEVERGVVVIEL